MEEEQIVLPQIAEEGEPPWVATKAAATLDIVQEEPNAEGEQAAPTDEQAPEQKQAEEEQVVTLKKDEYRRLMGLQGGLSTLQQQYHGIKAENAQLRQELEQLRALRQEIEQQRAEQAKTQQISTNLSAIRQFLAEKIHLTDEEWETAVAPLVQPLVEQALRSEQERVLLQKKAADAELAIRRMQGIEWLNARIPQAIQEVQQEFAALGARISLTPEDLRAVGASVETVRDFDHLKAFARDAAFRKAKSPGGMEQGPAQQQPNPVPAWAALPQSGSTAVTPATARRMYIEGKIDLDEYRKIVANASRQEKQLLPALFQ